MVKDIPVVLTVRAETTPSKGDPKGADEYYKALGICLMAFGRLEGHFVVCTLGILNLPGAQAAICRQLPMSWKRRAALWRDAFEAVTILQPAKQPMLQLLAEIMDHIQDRHAIVHGMWEDFTGESPLTVGTIHMKHKRGTEDGLDFRRADISLDLLQKLSATSNRLTLALLPFSRFLAAVRQPPPDAHKL